MSRNHPILSASFEDSVKEEEYENVNIMGIDFGSKEQVSKRKERVIQKKWKRN